MAILARKGLRNSRIFVNQGPSLKGTGLKRSLHKNVPPAIPTLLARTVVLLPTFVNKVFGVKFIFN